MVSKRITAAAAVCLAASVLTAAPSAGAATPRLTARAFWPVLDTSSVISVTGVVTPKAAGLPVQLQEMVAGRWRTLSKAQPQSSGRYSFLLRSPAAAAVWQLRVIRAATSSVKAEASATFTETINQAPVGAVVAWGDNEFATLGNGTRVSSLIPVPVSGPADVVAIASGQVAGYALHSDGTVWAWGDDAYGQLQHEAGDQPVPGAPDVPKQVVGLTNITAIAGGGSGSGYALRADGTVWAFGYNTDGELGDGKNVDSRKPVRVAGLTRIVAISGAFQDGYALRSDGTVWSWGYNGSDQLGDGHPKNTFGSEVPVRMAGLTGAVAVSGGADSVYVLRSDGTVWGAGVAVGDPSKLVYGHELVRVRNLSNITAVAAGSYGGYALKADRTVMAWGLNEDFEIGDGTRTDRPVPVPVKGLTQVTALCQDFGLTGCALRADGTEWIWGSDENGTLGDGGTTSRSVPGPVPGLSGVTAIVQGDVSGYALVDS